MNRLTWSERHHNALCKRWKVARAAGDGRLMMQIEAACDWLHARSLRKANRPPSNRNGRKWPAMQMNGGKLQ